MLESRPSPSPGNFIGYTLLLGIVLLDIGLLWLLVREPVTILSFLWGLSLLASLPAIALITYSTTSLATMRYHVADNALFIEWGRTRQVIPLAQIHSLVPGQKLETITAFRGIRWPGYLVGHGRVRQGSRTERPTGEATHYDTLFYATRPLPQQILVITDAIAYGISPIDLENFADCLAALRHAAPAGTAGVPPAHFTFLSWPIWRDRLAQMTWATAVTLNAFLFAYLCAIYNRLPALVPLHFNESGIADRLGTPANLFILPLAGLTVWLVNGVLGWLFYHWRGEQPIAYILWGTAIVVQLAAWAAVLGLLA